MNLDPIIALLSFAVVTLAVAAIMREIHPVSAEIEVINMTDAEWNQALARSLARVGLTWDQLAAQARYGEFESLEAKQLWLIAGPRGFIPTTTPTPPQETP